MLAYTLRRTLWIVPVLLVIATVTFFLMHRVPGGPWDREKRLPAETVAQLNRRYGLDEPLWVQYRTYLWNATRGDFGVSFKTPSRSVVDIVKDGVQTSAILGVLAAVLAVGVGSTLGILAALNQNGPLDYLSVFLATIGAATPSFVLAVLLVLLFAVNLGLLPTSGWGGPKEAVLPVISLAALPVAYIARVMRSSMLEVMRQDYVRTARAKGLRETSVVFRHILRNSLIPVITLLGPLVAGLVTGSFVIEYLFGLPGIGKEYVSSISARDYGVIMGTTLLYAVVIAVGNLVVDLLYAFVDPRIRYA
jgi:oligopeptide transport system permease protein